MSRKILGVWLAWLVFNLLPGPASATFHLVKVVHQEHAERRGRIPRIARPFAGGAEREVAEGNEGHLLARHRET